MIQGSFKFRILRFLFTEKIRFTDIQSLKLQKYTTQETYKNTLLA